MTDGNNDKGEIRKKCPFLGEWCIGDACALFTEMTRNQGGLIQKFGMCSFAGMTMILSEINQKTQPPQQKINIPGLFRG